MAKGLKCRECGQSCYAQDIRSEEKGEWVTYVCLNGNCPNVTRGGSRWQEKVFEGK